MKNWKKFLGVIATSGILGTAFSGIAYAAEYDAMNPPIAQVEQGLLRGYMDDGTYVFAGVPYATVPERFAMPEKMEKWEGVRDAQSWGAVSPIPAQTAVGADEMVWPHRYWVQNEACQNLNIWTQQINENAKKPVMVFIHGGGYTNGSSIEGVAYDGRNLSEFGDVVVVSLNHRLNILGFLDLSEYGEEYQNSANAGMEDIVAALQWIKDNIENFGGDPDNITLFGQSAGGGKILTLMRMPEAEGLFDKAIIQSGGGNYISKEHAQEIAGCVLENLGLNGDQIDELKTVPYSDLIKAGQAALATVQEGTDANIKWWPEMDGTYVQEDFCSWTSDIPFMVGSVFAEQNSTFNIGDGRKNEWTQEETMANLKERYGDNAEAIAEEFQKLFPGRNVADAYFYAPFYRQRVESTLAMKLENATAPVYSYMFNYEIPVNGGTAAFHCCDLIYVFHNVDIPVLTRACGGDETTHRLQEQMAGAWVAFAKTGSPDQEGLAWKEYTEDEKNVMLFDVESKCQIFEDHKMTDLMQEK